MTSAYKIVVQTVLSKTTFLTDNQNATSLTVSMHNMYIFSFADLLMVSGLTPISYEPL